MLQIESKKKTRRAGKNRKISSIKSDKHVCSRRKQYKMQPFLHSVRLCQPGIGAFKSNVNAIKDEYCPYAHFIQSSKHLKHVHYISTVETNPTLLKYYMQLEETKTKLATIQNIDVIDISDYDTIDHNVHSISVTTNDSNNNTIHAFSVLRRSEVEVAKNYWAQQSKTLTKVLKAKNNICRGKQRKHFAKKWVLAGY